MKRVAITLCRGDDVSAWQTDTPGLAAWKHTDLEGFDYTRFPKDKMPWCLIHVPSGRTVAQAYKRDDIVALAARLDGIGNWAMPVPELDMADRAVKQIIEWKRDMHRTRAVSAADKGATASARSASKRPETKGVAA